MKAWHLSPFCGYLLYVSSDLYLTGHQTYLNPSRLKTQRQVIDLNLHSLWVPERTKVSGESSYPWGRGQRLEQKHLLEPAVSLTSEDSCRLLEGSEQRQRWGWWLSLACWGCQSPGVCPKSSNNTAITHSFLSQLTRGDSDEYKPVLRQTWVLLTRRSPPPGGTYPSGGSFCRSFLSLGPGAVFL